MDTASEIQVIAFVMMDGWARIVLKRVRLGITVRLGRWHILVLLGRIRQAQECGRFRIAHHVKKARFHPRQEHLLWIHVRLARPGLSNRSAVAFQETARCVVLERIRRGWECPILLPALVVSLGRTKLDLEAHWPRNVQTALQELTSLTQEQHLLPHVSHAPRVHTLMREAADALCVHRELFSR